MCVKLKQSQIGAVPAIVCDVNKASVFIGIVEGRNRPDVGELVRRDRIGIRNCQGDWINPQVHDITSVSVCYPLLNLPDVVS